jgi:hypothetical protein
LLGIDLFPFRVIVVIVVEIALDIVMCFVVVVRVCILCSNLFVGYMRPQRPHIAVVRRSMVKVPSHLSCQDADKGRENEELAAEISPSQIIDKVLLFGF